MPIPRVAIVGRPNVGKSSIFNWIDGRRLAIVDSVAGVTRDRMMTLIESNGRHFELIDTGGMGIEDVDNLTKDVEAQIEAGIEEADVLLFTVDTRSGLVPLDYFVADRLRKVDKPILLVANKTDHPDMDVQAEEFRKLGRGWLVTVSAEQNRNREHLLELILQRLPDVEATDEEIAAPVMKVAMVGRRNVGKSTFVNTLAKAERMIVSEVPGTTRDSVDVHFELDGQKFIAIDTPGLRRNKSIKTDIDYYGLHRAQRSIRRADVVLLFFDCTSRLSRVDKQLAHYIVEQYKPCVLVVNKWDKLAGQMPTERWVRYLRENFPTMAYCPIAFVTGQTGKNVKALLNHSQMLFKQANQRISTGQLNRLVKAALETHPPPLHHLKRPKVYYATQVSTTPPTIVLMCNNPQGFPGPYQRYLLGFLRDHLPFSEVPIKLYLQSRQRDDTRDEIQLDRSHAQQDLDNEELNEDFMLDDELVDDELVDDELVDDELVDEEIATDEELAGHESDEEEVDDETPVNPKSSDDK